MLQFCCHLSLHCSAAPDHHEASGPGDWYRARARGGIRHEASHLDQGFIALHPRGWEGDSAQTRSSPRPWIVSWMNWTKLNMKHVIIVSSCWWRLSLTVWELWTSGQHFIPGVFPLYQLYWTVTIKRKILFATRVFHGPGTDSIVSSHFAAIPRVQAEGCDSQGQLQPGNIGRRLPTSWDIRHRALQTLVTAALCHGGSLFVHPNKVWRTNAEEILISFI